MFAILQTFHNFTDKPYLNLENLEKKHKPLRPEFFLQILPANWCFFFFEKKQFPTTLKFVTIVTKY